MAVIKNASKVRISFNSRGFHDILMGDGVHDMLQGRVEAIQAKAACGCDTSMVRGYYGGGRWLAFVTADSKEARRAEAVDMALSRAVMQR